MRKASTLALALLGGSALIQAAPARAADAAAAATADPSSSQVQEVVVTAEKRSQTLQNLPVAVSVVTVQSAAAMGVTDVESLETAVPGLQFPREFNGTTPTLRGVGTNVGIGSAESVVAMYIDDVYIASPAATTFSFNNVSQIEVLKGPQGTLYGRNAEGGVVDIKTRDPSASPSADMSLGFANYDTYSGGFYGNTALTNTLFADLALSATDQVQGWGKNLFDDKPAYRDDEFAARAKVLWKPDSLTSVTLSADFSRAVYNEGIAMSPIPGALFPNGQTYQGLYNVNETPEGQTDTRQEGISLRGERDLGFADLIYISGYRSVQSINTADEDQTVANTQTFHYDDDRRTWTNEVRLVSRNWRNLHWIAGLFYFDDISDLSPFILTGSAVPAPFTSLTESFQVETHSYAGFGQLTYDLPMDFHLTVGGRYTYDQVSLKGTEALDTLMVASNPGQSTQDRAPTYKVNLSKTLIKDVMAYVGYSTGFKGGTFNTATLFGAPVKPEHLNDLEAGLKSELFDRRLRLDLVYFHYDYNNQQVATLIEANGRTSTILQNAASSTNNGFELEFEGHPTSDFTLSGSVEAMRSRFQSFPNATISVPLPGGGNNTVSGSAAGFATPHSPDFTSNLTGTYDLATRVGDVFFAADYYYNSGFAWDVDNRLKQSAYNIVNGSITWKSDNKDWSVRLWGKNLTNTRYSIYTTANIVGDEESPAPPLTYGVTVSRHF